MSSSAEEKKNPAVDDSPAIDDHAVKKMQDVARSLSIVATAARAAAACERASYRAFVEAQDSDSIVTGEPTSSAPLLPQSAPKLQSLLVMTEELMVRTVADSTYNASKSGFVCAQHAWAAARAAAMDQNAIAISAVCRAFSFAGETATHAADVSQYVEDACNFSAGSFPREILIAEILKLEAAAKEAKAAADVAATTAAIATAEAIAEAANDAMMEERRKEDARAAASSTAEAVAKATTIALMPFNLQIMSAKPVVGLYMTTLAFSEMHVRVFQKENGMQEYNFTLTGPNEGGRMEVNITLRDGELCTVNMDLQQNKIVKSELGAPGDSFDFGRRVLDTCMSFLVDSGLSFSGDRTSQLK